MGDFTPTLYPGGVSNAQLDSFGARVPMLWPPQFYTFFTDFDRFLAATSGAVDWLTTLIDVGAGTTSVVLADALGGVVLITTAGNEDDGAMVQWVGSKAAGTVAETFTFTPGKRSWFTTRFRMSDVTQSDFIVGLAIADTTPLDASDGVFFLKVDGSAVLTLTSKITTPVVVSANLATLVAATWYEVGYEYNGVDAITAYIRNTDGTWSPVGSLGVTALPTTELAVTFGFQNGEAAAKTCEIDYIFAARER